MYDLARDLFSHEIFSNGQKYLFENFEEIFEKKLDGRTPGLSEEVSCDELGIPYIPCRGRVLRFVVPA